MSQLTDLGRFVSLMVSPGSWVQENSAQSGARRVGGRSG